MSEQQNAVDRLTEQLRASNVTDGAPSEDWKQGLNLPPRDGRQQTEVRHIPGNLDLSIRLPKANFPSPVGRDEHQRFRIRGL